MKPDLNFIENSVDPDQKPADRDSPCFPRKM